MLPVGGSVENFKTVDVNVFNGAFLCPFSDETFIFNNCWRLHSVLDFVLFDPFATKQPKCFSTVMGISGLSISATNNDLACGRNPANKFSCFAHGWTSWTRLKTWQPIVRFHVSLSNGLQSQCVLDQCTSLFLIPAMSYTGYTRVLQLSNPIGRSFSSPDCLKASRLTAHWFPFHTKNITPAEWN